MLIYSISVSVDGYIADRDGNFDWTAPDDELLAFHHHEVAGLGGYLLGRRLWETMLVWETDPEMREQAFGAVWRALPKVVFSRTLEDVEGSARLATGTLAEEAAALDGIVSVGGAGLAAEAIGLGLLDEVRVFRCPVIVGGGTPHLPPHPDRVALDLVETRRFESGVVFERYQRADPTGRA